MDITSKEGKRVEFDISDYEEEDDKVKIVEPVKEQWDCESILSTYSNLYNHPKLIEEPKKVSGRLLCEIYIIFFELR